MVRVNGCCESKLTGSAVTSGWVPPLRFHSPMPGRPLTSSAIRSGPVLIRSKLGKPLRPNARQFPLLPPPQSWCMRLTSRPGKTPSTARNGYPALNSTHSRRLATSSSQISPGRISTTVWLRSGLLFRRLRAASGNGSEWFWTGRIAKAGARLKHPCAPPLAVYPSNRKRISTSRQWNGRRFPPSSLICAQPSTRAKSSGWRSSF